MAQYPLVPRVGGSNSSLNITAATVVKATPGTLVRISVTTAGTSGAAGAAYDASATSGDTAANLIASIPNSVGIIDLQWPCRAGILVVPGASQVLSVSFS